MEQQKPHAAVVPITDCRLGETGKRLTEEAKETNPGPKCGKVARLPAGVYQSRSARKKDYPHQPPSSKLSFVHWHCNHNKFTWCPRHLQRSLPAHAPFPTGTTKPCKWISACMDTLSAMGSRGPAPVALLNADRGPPIYLTYRQLQMRI